MPTSLFSVSNSVSIGQRAAATHAKVANSVSAGAWEKKQRGSLPSRFCRYTTQSTSPGAPSRLSRRRSAANR